MAEENDDDLMLAPADAGTAFRAEMAATNFFMGYWKHILAVLITGLVMIFIYGQIRQYGIYKQRVTAQQIAEVERDLPTAIANLPALKMQGGLPPAEDLEAAAAQLNAIASASSGTAKVEALLKASELYRLSGADEARKTALVSAAEHADGLLMFAAESALASMELDAGEGDAALARFKKLAASNDAFLAQEASIELGRTYRILERDSDAQQTLSDFLAKWPNAPRAAEVERMRAEIGSNG